MVGFFFFFTTELVFIGSVWEEALLDYSLFQTLLFTPSSTGRNVVGIATCGPVHSLETESLPQLMARLLANIFLLLVSGTENHLNIGQG